MSASQVPAEGVEGQLPEGVREQTKQEFEKLKKHNQELSEKLSRLEAEQLQPKFNSVLEEMPLNQSIFADPAFAPAPDLTQGLIDENGYIDQGRLNQTLTEAQLRAKRAEDQALIAQQRIERFEETQLVRDVHSKHPTLDPYNANFDREFYDRVKGEVQTQLKKGYQDFQAAADKVAAELAARSKDQTAQQKAEEEDQKKVLAQREQASTAGVGKKSQSTSHEELEIGLRKGDNQAIGQLLKDSGY